MMRALLTLLLLSMASPLAAAPWQLERSDVLTVASEDGHAYRVMVAWPDGPPPPDGWPALWVLDGEDNFVAVAQTARRLARARDRSGVLPGLVIAIESGSLERRVLDYTPPVPGYVIPAGAPASGRAIGGGDRFLAFLEERVRPEIARRWRTDPGRQILLGHSFGALVATHALLRGSSFTGIVAVSPSLWYGDGLLAREAQAFPGPRPGGPRLALVAMGDEGAPAGHNPAAAEALVGRLNQTGISARFLRLQGLGHGSTLPAALGDAVDFAFDPVEHP